MQLWMPQIGSAAGPKYLAIAHALAEDIKSGALLEGTRLPAQRALAEALGVDLTTVTRAYGEAQRLGLIEGDGRRGSFVRRQQTAPSRPTYKEPADAGMNAPPQIPGGKFATEFHRSVADLLVGSGGPGPFQYQPSGGLALAREAGAELLGGRGIPCQEDTILVAAGGQHALHAIVSAEMRPGDRLAVPAYVYPGLLALARRYGLKFAVVESDQEGIDPASLAAACEQHQVRAVYVVPTNDNPTTATMGIERRQALAAVARRYGLLVIEDDAYGLLPTTPLPPIASMAPELTWHIASVAKVLSPGLRVAWLSAPDVAKAWRLAADMHETAIMAPPLNAAVVAGWVTTGMFQQLTNAIRAEAQARQSIVRDCLPPGSFRSQEEGYHLWIPLPRETNAGEIVNTLRPHGLSVVAGDAFMAEPGYASEALRVSIGGSIPRDRLQRGLRLLGAMIGPEATGRISLV